ncbi:MAG TPA: NADH-quinone oxidoreductase subunit NuoG [Anaerolineales bacterium]|nr:NADH-quinone oxidoreductase subunit NuoG [Anaerolineales bacterium]
MMAKIFIDGKTYEVDPADNLLHVALSLGFDLPYFCWHPAMGSVGACRQCAVKQFKDENDTRGRLVMACMTPAAEGTRISIHDPEAAEFRASVIEWLMLNHPHDCPVCDEGGECHLQDMTVMTGHVYRRNRFKKRTYRNQYLGPFIHHEMNRCIQCYRCVRFYRDYAGGRDLDVFAAHDHVYFGRHEDGVLESEFSGNLVEVCPTGVFTDKTLQQHYTRKWDLQTAPSICAHCGLGCNTIPGERYGSLRRIVNRYHEEVNGYFLCDRGRYGYEFVNSPERIRQSRIKSAQPGELGIVPVEEVLSRLGEMLAPGTPLVGIGSPRASLEANFALRSLTGPENFFAGISANEARLHHRILNILREGPVPVASLREVERSDAVLVLGEDLTNTAPRLALALRQSVRNQPLERARQRNIDLWNDAALREIIQDEKGPLYILAPAGTRLDDVATSTTHLAPDDLARLGFAIAHLLDSAAPEVSGLPAELSSRAEEIAETLKAAKNPLIVSGTSLGSEAVIQAAASIAWALKAVNPDTRIVLTVPERNSLGLALLDNKDLDDAQEALERNPNAMLVILENDLYRRASTGSIDKLFDSAGQVVVIDSLENRTTAKADLVLPAATFAEGDGTLVNYEGRAQRYFQVLPPRDEIRESWRWIDELMRARHHELHGTWNDLDDVLRALSEQAPVFAPVLEIAPPEGFRLVEQKIPRQPHRYSGRTANRANITVHEPKPPDDPDAPLAFSMEGYKGQPPPSLIPRYWAPGWNSVQALNKFQAEVGGPLIGGSPGRRLIEPSAEARPSYPQDIPDAFVPREDEYLALPLYHIFGSEELSRLAPAIAERTPEVHAVLHPALAEKLAAADGQSIQIRLEGDTIRLPLRLDASLPEDLVGLPAGFPGIPANLPGWVKIELVSEEGA